MSDPTVTVLMTVYNAGRFLDPSIRSILRQSFRDFEFLIVDDGSIDGSAEAAEAWAARDSRIRLVRNAENRGQTNCLNQGLGLARGQWIARHDADDLSHPARLTAQFRFTTSRPDVVLVGSNGRIIDEQDRLVGLLDAPLTQSAIVWTSPFLNPFMHSSVMVRTRVIRDEFGGYDAGYRIAQDYELWTRIMSQHETANLPQRLIAYRHLATSMSKAGREQAFAEAAVISAREAERVFGRAFTDSEARLVAAFREGLDSSSRKEFWDLYDHLLTSRDARTDDLARTMALHHLKAAGALSSKSRCLALTEIVTALRTDFAATLRWLATRYLNA